jgi:protein-L-isoaspartate(D-aspartate) O-methyltransferase
LYNFSSHGKHRKIMQMKQSTLFLVLIISILSVRTGIARDDQSATDPRADERAGMIAEIEKDVRDTAGLINRGGFDRRVMDAMATVPRHEFVPENQRRKAYENRPLPIGRGQTISQPYIVALMTDLLEPQPGDRVLEIGTGSGYQAAVLSHLVSQVYSMEIIAELGKESRQRMQRLGYENISIRIEDGYNGWPEEAPFDSIIVTAAISHIPPPLVSQLKPGGRMVIPVGTRFQTQYLTLVEKDLDGGVTTRQLIPVIFVPFTGGHQ